MSEKTTFTNPKKPGADQSTEFVHTKYAENGRGERERAKVSKTSHSRGENRFAQFPTAK